MATPPRKRARYMPAAIQEIDRVAEGDEMVFGDPEKWKELMARAKEAFIKAEELDPSNTHAAEWSFGLKPMDAGEEPL